MNLCSEARDVCFWAPGWYQIENFLKMFKLVSPLARWYQFGNFLIFFELVCKKEFRFCPKKNLDSFFDQPASKPANLTAILAVIQSNH